MSDVTEVIVQVPSDVTEVVVQVPSPVSEVVVYEGLTGPKGDPGSQGPQGDPTIVNGKSGASITLDYSDVGADPAGAAAAAQTAAEGYADTAIATAVTDQLAQPNGIATLDDSGKVPAEQLPEIGAVKSVDGRTGDVTLGDLYDAAGSAASTLTAANNYADSVVGLAVIDANSYTDTAIATAVTDQLAQPDGIATLDASGKVPNSQLSPLAITNTFVVNSQAAMLALVAQVGDVAIRTDLSQSFILASEPASTLANWQEMLTPPNAVLSVDGRVGAVSLTDLYDASGAAAAAQASAQNYTSTNFTPLTDPRLTDARIPTGSAGGDLTGNYPSPTLAPTGTAGTYTKVTTDAAGRVSSGASLSKTDIPNLDAAQVTGTAVTQADTGTVTSTMIANGTIVDSDISASAAIATSKLAANSVTIDAQTVALGGSINVLPTDGPAGYILAKSSATNFDIAWVPNDTTQVHQYVKNDTGAPMYKGQAVYISGASGANVLVTLAQANSDLTSATTIGVLEADIPNGSFGYVVTEGAVAGLNTSGLTEGDPIWLSPTTPGGLLYGTANKPYAPAHLVFMGIVTRANPSVGSYFIKVSNGWELDELHNVYARSPNNKDGLLYNSSTQLWEARAIAASDVTGTAVTQADTGTVTSTMIANGTIVDSDISASAAIALSKLGQSSAASGQAPVWGGAAWVPGTPLPARATAAFTTASIADGATATGTVAMAKGYTLLSIRTSVAARVRLYVSSAARDADLTRTEGTDPAWNAGVICDIVVPAGNTVNTLSPGIFGANMEASPSSSARFTVTNKSGSASAITVTLVYIPQEA